MDVAQQLREVSYVVAETTDRFAVIVDRGLCAATVAFGFVMIVFAAVVRIMPGSTVQAAEFITLIALGTALSVFGAGLRVYEGVVRLRNVREAREAAYNVLAKQFEAVERRADKLAEAARTSTESSVAKAGDFKL